ncbi:Proteasome subunit alpha type-7-A [Platanthera zijinensis]|uniref:Proteasome subunit alpha type-7-A n=1 Tax=Platanthera zijinensis TaxID=2320716 RepID=A0AAP0BQD3_9ASPA
MTPIIGTSLLSHALPIRETLGGAPPVAPPIGRHSSRSTYLTLKISSLGFARHLHHHPRSGEEGYPKVTRLKVSVLSLTLEDPVTVEYITRYIAGLQQKYTRSGNIRPLGLSTLIIGFDPYTRTSSLYQTDPPGTFSAWKANATGRNSNSMREFL